MGAGRGRLAGGAFGNIHGDERVVRISTVKAAPGTYVGAGKGVAQERRSKSPADVAGMRHAPRYRIGKDFVD
ncbi:MAG: hypothetical protein BroJett030_19840 [Alphaproteobacteria bacterium]|nr:MAG: hypothetical protein BroJett030_19840 [Alphaproteobacteria bacterium]